MTRPAIRTPQLGLAVLCLVVLLGCFGGGTPVAATPPPPVSDEEAARFASRVEQFYAMLQGVSLPALMTFQNPKLRGYFSSASAYADYYSALATLAREYTLRDGQANSVRIKEFRFDGPEQAVVDVVVTGKHERELRFWDIDLERSDVWHRIDGVWVIVPEKL
ncbi:MAG: hypothetical protein ACREBE_17650 [bacterium]